MAVVSRVVQSGSRLGQAATFRIVAVGTTDQNNIPNRVLSNSSSGIMVSARGAIGASVVATSWTAASLVTGAMRIVRTTSKLFAISASDCMSAVPINGFMVQSQHVGPSVSVG
jgi:hypothetical protein